MTEPLLEQLITTTAPAVLLAALIIWRIETRLDRLITRIDTLIERQAPCLYQRNSAPPASTPTTSRQ